MTADEGRSRAPSSASDRTSPRADSVDEFERLRDLLLGEEQRRLARLEERIEADLTADEVAAVLPEAVAQGSSADALARALAPTIERGITDSVQRNPEPIAEAIYPAIGPAIRKAIGDTMAGFVATLNRAIEYRFSWQGLRWQLEAWRTGVPYAQIVIRHALVYQVEQALLIHRDSGLLLAHAATHDRHTSDADLVSSMLTAIRDFVTDSFDAAGEGGLRSFNVGDRTVFVEAGPQAMIAAVVRGQAPRELFGRLQETLEGIHYRFHTPLREFDGDSAPFEAAVPALEDCLETVLESADRDSTARARWLLAGVAAVVVIVALLGARSWWRWRQVVTALEAIPGVVLVEADRGWFGGVIHGLRDPLADDPAAALNASGLDSDRYDLRWRPYLSLDPAMVQRRAAAALAPPDTARLQLDDGVLRVSGSATPAWLARARVAAAGIAGLEALDLDDVEPAESPELTALRAELESRRVLFGRGSSALDADARAELERIGADLAALTAQARRDGWGLGLELVGRTDDSGSAETNGPLSLDRARAVQAALAQAGWTVDRATVIGLGVEEPLPAADAERRDQLNRSVSFRVLLQPEGVLE